MRRRCGARSLMQDVMRPLNLTLESLVSPDLLSPLEADCISDGRVMVDRLVQEWRDGRNRFSQPGERAYVAKLGARVSGVCGLNRDPFANDPSVGRLRRLYVAVADRRLGLGTAIVEKLMADAQGVFSWIHLRTHDPEAAAFYEAIGFESVSGDHGCTHRRRVVA